GSFKNSVPAWSWDESRDSTSRRNSASFWHTSSRNDWRLPKSSVMACSHTCFTCCQRVEFISECNGSTKPDDTTRSTTGHSICLPSVGNRPCARSGRRWYRLRCWPATGRLELSRHTEQ